MTAPFALMTDPATGRVALFDENGVVGDRGDPNSAINAPLNNPASFLDHIRFHSDLDHFEVAFAGSGAITHASIAGIATGGGLTASFSYDATGDDSLLLTHSLGYVPLALVAVGSNILWPGMPVQTNGDGGGRYATAYADTSALRLGTIATIGASNLTSVTLVYSWLVFKEPPVGSGHILIDFDPLTGITSLGLGKFSSDKPYLQVRPGGSPLGLSNGRSIDLDNGAPKAWNPDTTTFAPVPAGLKTFLPHTSWFGGDFGGAAIGASMAYSGSYAGPTSIQVQAP